MNPLTPGYGETPLPLDELSYLLPAISAGLEHPISRSVIDDLESVFQEIVVTELSLRVISGELAIADLLTAHFLRELHSALYGKVWSWAGIFRLNETNIGVAPEIIATEVHLTLDNLRYRWQSTSDWTAREFGIAVHAELVRIHPFIDGNGRTTRILAGLVFASLQDGPTIAQYDWDVERATYIALLNKFVITRDAKPLAAFIPLLSSGD